MIVINEPVVTGSVEWGAAGAPGAAESSSVGGE